MSVGIDDIAAAHTRIKPLIVRTPVVQIKRASGTVDTQMHLKLENRQHTGSFKARGALNKILILNETGFTGPIITASTGNHALGVARALSFTDLQGTIYVPKEISRAKLKKLQTFNVSIEFVDGDPLRTELTAKEQARIQGAAWISPYNDPEIIAGQGTIGPELTTELPEIAALYVTVGGGGLASGVATWMKHFSPQTQIIGCLPSRSPEMKLSVEAGHIVHLEPALQTLSDGSAGGCEDDSITYPICREFIDRYILIDEEEIALAIRSVYQNTGERIEGSAGVAIAAMEKDNTRFSGDPVVAIVCGGNIEDVLFEQIINDDFKWL